jgi:hypothetical protein
MIPMPAIEVPMEEVPRLKRLPKHIGIIPVWNRRWAASLGLKKS